MTPRRPHRLLCVAAAVGAMAIPAPAGGAPGGFAHKGALKADTVVMVLGSSVSVRRYGVHPLPKWTGGPERVPPQCTNGQNVFFRAFEMLNDHENMRWRRLMDRDWTRQGRWNPEKNLPYRSASPRIAYAATDPTAFAELAIPAGYEKVELIYASGPKGDRMKVTVDGEPPEANAVVDTFQDRSIPSAERLGPQYGTFDSHGKVRKIRRPARGISHIVELRARYRVDAGRAHRLRVQRAGTDPEKRILIWGAVYWRGNCVQVVQRAKGGINCGDLPNYPAVQEVTALKPDYVLMEAINIREGPAVVTRSLGPGFAWCGRQMRRKQFKVLVYATPQASSREFRKWFSVPANRPPYGASDYRRTCSNANADACHQAVVELCRKYGFPMVDVGAEVDAYVAAQPTVRFVPHILNDWYHPNQWGAALFGRALLRGIRRHWPELPVRPTEMPRPPKWTKPPTPSTRPRASR